MSRVARPQGRPLIEVLGALLCAFRGHAGRAAVRRHEIVYLCRRCGAEL